MNKRYHEMLAEDARRIAAEWREMGYEDARAMFAMAAEATRKGEPLPEPAEQAKDQLRAYLPRADVEIAWVELLRKIESQLR